MGVNPGIQSIMLFPQSSSPASIQIVVWIVGIAAVFSLLVFAAVRFFTGLPRHGWTRSFSRALWRILAANIIAFMLPLVVAPVFASGMFDAFGVFVLGIAETIYAIIQTVAISAPVSDCTEVARACLGDAAPAAVTTYAILLNVLAIVTPFVVVTSAMGSLVRRLQHLRYAVARRKHRVAYVFSDLSHASVLLASDIFAHSIEAAQPQVGHQFPTLGSTEPDTSLRPLVVFCGVTSQVKADNSDLIQTLRDQGRGNVAFTQESIAELVSELMGFTAVHCFVFTEDHGDNREIAADLISAISELTAWRSRTSDGSFDADDACDMARKFSVYCTNESREDELFFDSLGGGETEPTRFTARKRLSQRQRRELGQTACEAQKQIELRLVSMVQERIFDALANHPLFEVLDPIDAHVAEANPQELWVLLVGLGLSGTKALETVYWMGRLHGVRLHILGIDARGEEIRRRLCVTHPEMMTECGADGAPVVRIEEAETFTQEFEGQLRTLPADARVYAMVMLGNDQLNLDVALSLRRSFDDLVLEGHLADPGPEKRPMVLPLICAHETFDAARNMTTERKERFEITPFGRNRTVFSFVSIIVAVWEQYALAMAAAYHEMWENPVKQGAYRRGTQAHVRYEDAVKDYSEYEIKKLSSRTCVRHIPYRLWSLGIDPKQHFNEMGLFVAGELTNERWLEALGITDLEADYLLRQMNTHDTDLTAQRIEFLRGEFPIICRLADLEHERWMAFYRSQGWRDLTIEDCQRLVDMGIIESLGKHQSPKLRRHCYLCDIDTLVQRGVALQDDPFVYDRAAIVETQRILEGTIFAEEVD